MYYVAQVGSDQRAGGDAPSAGDRLVVMLKNPNGTGEASINIITDQYYVYMACMKKRDPDGGWWLEI